MERRRLKVRDFDDVVLCVGTKFDCLYNVFGYDVGSIIVMFVL